MNNIEQVLYVILIGLAVVLFLRNTSRIPKAIEVCEECLVLLNNQSLDKQNMLIESFYKTFHRLVIEAYQRISDYQSARRHCRELIVLNRKSGNRAEEGKELIKMATLYEGQGQFGKAKELMEEALALSNEIGDRGIQAESYSCLGMIYKIQGECLKAKEYLNKALSICKEIGNRQGEAKIYGALGTVFRGLGEYSKAKEHHEKALGINKKIGNRKVVARDYGNLATVFQCLAEHAKAKECLEKSLAIVKEVGDRDLQATNYTQLGTVLAFLGEYVKAKENQTTALLIAQETGDKYTQAASHAGLGNSFQLLGEYKMAVEHYEKALVIQKEIGHREGEASSIGNLGVIFQYLGEYDRAEEYHQIALIIRKEIGDKEGEASSYNGLGSVCFSRGDYVKANAYHKKALTITKEIAFKSGEAESHRNLGEVSHSLGEYDKAKEYHQKDLEIRKEIGDRKGEASSYRRLGDVSSELGDLSNANEYNEKALAINEEMGDKCEVASSNESLGVLHYSLGEYLKAIEYQEKALTINQEQGNRASEANINVNIGYAFLQMHQYDKAHEYIKRSLEIAIAIGDRRQEAAGYSGLGTLWRTLCNYEKAKEYHGKALAIRKEIGDRAHEAVDYGNLGTVCKFLGEWDEAEENFKRAITINEEIGNVPNQIPFLCNLALLKVSEGKVQEAYTYLHSSVQKCEEMRGLLGQNDQFKISFSDKHDFPYWLLSDMLCSTGNHNEALCVSELGRARALADLMASQYSVENHITANPQSWVGAERIIMKEINSTCLFITYSAGKLLLWVIKKTGVIHFRQTKVNETFAHSRDVSKDDGFFAQNFRTFPFLPEKNCENRSLSEMQPTLESSPDDSIPDVRSTEEDKESQAKSHRALGYQLIIAPVVEFFKEPEIVIVPDGSLYKVPFAALQDESGKWLSETFRIRIVPSLTTLKLIHDSPTNYHSQTGALIVGDPDVGRVRYRGCLKTISRLPCAGKEVEMIGRLLDVPPLLGQQATKEAVLERLNSVSLLHLAAHGDADTGEIALAPKRPTSRKIPREEDYLLKMSDISKAQLRAKLVVLSCCHSGRGQIRAEGVVGIARAFLGSGARSVLVALWAIDDEATEQFMHCFYKHLVRGESASECLYEAMKWMRGNGFSDVTQWAPFMLMGDNVTFDFKRTKEEGVVISHDTPSADDLQ